MPGQQHALGALSAFVLLCLGAAASSQGEPAPPLSWFVHLSDVHISAEDPSRGPDLERLGAQVFAALQPQAVVLTGDLTHAKRKQPFAGRQNEAEWEEYAALIDSLVASTGLPRQAIVDIRGNHDTFDVRYTGDARDFYSEYSSHGTRGMGGDRIYSRSITPPQQTPDDNSTSASCPSAVLIGIDATPGYKLRSPLNFAGVVTPPLMRLLDNALSEAAEVPEGCERRPQIVAYSHYPLSVIQHMGKHHLGRAGAGVSTSGHPLEGGKDPGEERILEMLLRHGARLALNGHLHAAFGPRLHWVHRSSGGVSHDGLAELELASWKYERRFRLVTIDGDDISFADLEMISGEDPTADLDPTGSCRLPEAGGLHVTLSDEEAPSEGGIRGNNSSGGVTIRSVDPSRRLGPSMLVAITSPPDIRYFPTSTSFSRDSPPDVRAVVFPTVSSGSPAASDEGSVAASAVRARACWSCMQGGASGTPQQVGCEAMRRIGSGSAWPVRFEAELPGSATALNCWRASGSRIVLQVMAHEDDGVVGAGSMSTTCSEERWIGAPDEANGQQLLDVTWIERFTLSVDWPMIIAWLLGGLLMLHFAVIAGAPYAAEAIAQLPGGRSNSSKQTGLYGRLLGGLLTPFRWLVDASVLHPGIWNVQFGYSCWLLAAPWLAGTLVTGSPLGLVASWGVVVHTGDQGSPPEECRALWGGAWAWCPTADVVFYLLPALVLIHFPATLWLAAGLFSAPPPTTSASSSSITRLPSLSSLYCQQMKRRPQQSQASPRSAVIVTSSSTSGRETTAASAAASSAAGFPRLLSWMIAVFRWALGSPWLAVTGALLGLLNVWITRRIAGELGWMAALACPGITWRVPVAVASLAWAHNRGALITKRQ